VCPSGNGDITHEEVITPLEFETATGYKVPFTITEKDSQYYISDPLIKNMKDVKNHLFSQAKDCYKFILDAV